MQSLLSRTDYENFHLSELNTVVQHYGKTSKTFSTEDCHTILKENMQELEENAHKNMREFRDYLSQFPTDDTLFVDTTTNSFSAQKLVQKAL